MGDELHLSTLHWPASRFQPTPPYGDEQKAMQQIVDRENYNPHHPQGDEQVFPSLFLFFMHFNPHPRMGMNYAVFTAPPVAKSFQPTPPYGDEQKIVWQSRVNEANFNPHPRMGMNSKKNQ